MKRLLLPIILTMFMIPLIAGCQDQVYEEIIKIPTLLVNEKKPPANGSPDDYTPFENLQFAAYNFNRAQTWKSSYSGEVTAMGIKQQVRNNRVYDNGILFCESLSVSALKKVGEQKYFSGNNILVRQYKKIDKNTISATWSDSITKITTDEYYKKYGLKPNEIFKYVINESTISSSEKVDGSGFVYKFVLSANCAEYLKREVRAMAGAKSDAEFLEVECTIEVDKNWNVIRTTTNERYKVAIFGNITCVSSSSEEFEVNNSVSIPDKELFKSYASNIEIR